MPIEGAKKDKGHSTPEWDVKRELIDGVIIKEVKNIVTGNGVTRELFRPEWGLCNGAVKHMVHVVLNGKGISAWHMHEIQTDHIFVITGHCRWVLWDDREGSKTHGKLDVFNLSPARPQVLAVPPGVWHGVQNLSADESAFINYFTHAYDYNNPDEWRLPWNTDKIPHKFGGAH